MIIIVVIMSEEEIMKCCFDAVLKKNMMKLCLMVVERVSIAFGLMELGYCAHLVRFLVSMKSKET